MNDTISNKKKTLQTEWSDTTTKDEFILYKSDGSEIRVKKGSWVKIPGRKDKVIIDCIVKSSRIDETSGPLGISYLPWRYDEKKFASISWSMKGNRRFIICYPCGRLHYGGHIDWEYFELCDPPDNLNLEMEQEVLTVLDGSE
jgi:hypothetical protein